MDVDGRPFSASTGSTSGRATNNNSGYIDIAAEGEKFVGRIGNLHIYERGHRLKLDLSSE